MLGTAKRHAQNRARLQALGIVSSLSVLHSHGQDQTISALTRLNNTKLNSLPRVSYPYGFCHAICLVLLFCNSYGLKSSSIKEISFSSLSLTTSLISLAVELFAHTCILTLALTDVLLANAMRLTRNHSATFSLCKL